MSRVISYIRNWWNRIRWLYLLREGLIVAAVYFTVIWYQNRYLSDNLPNQMLESSSGKMVSLLSGDSSSQLVFVIAPWCTICKANLPMVHRAAPGYVGRIKILVNDITREAELSQLAAAYPNLVFLKGNQYLADQLGISGYPTAFFASGYGKVRFRTVGYLTGIGLWFRMRL